MDKSWINDKNRFSKRYIDGVESFIQLATKEVLRFDNTVLCPCRDCNNVRYRTLDIVKRHLIFRGFAESYKEFWHLHGERLSTSSENNHVPNDDMHNNFNDMDENIIDEFHELVGDMTDAHDSASMSTSDVQSFHKLVESSQQELYPGCKKYSLLKCIVKLLHLKVLNKWSNNSFNMLLETIKEFLPEGERLPSSLYGARKVLSSVGLGYELIEVCKYDCALFWKENIDKTKCPICKEPRWRSDNNKGKKIPHKVLRYFPLTPRLQRLYMSNKTAADMRWHKERRVHEEGVMSHPADTPAWKELDTQFPLFASDSRNVKLGLASDGFNPFGNMYNSYSMWPVILIPYNLPPYMYMKEPYLMMSLLIPGPRSPGRDIDIFMRPLIDELKELWDNGIQTYDAYSGEQFQMRASLLWTINDFPAYGNLSSWSVHGYKACPSCYNETESEYFNNKICYTGHRRFLTENHPYRSSKVFNGKIERRPKPRNWSGEDVLEWVESVEPMFASPGKHPQNKRRKRGDYECNWVKKSIFFELPYWKTLLLRHNLDVMHIEKNIGEALLGTLLNMKGKTKDTIKAREHLKHLNIRKELWLQKQGDKIVKPQACYTLTKTEVKSFCDFLKAIKFPDGYASNIRRCVRDNTVVGLKTHDIHILLQRIIPVGVRGLLRKDVAEAIFDLGEFFKELCSKKLKVENIEKMEKNVPLILCKLERIYPPAFFDVMVHLAVHLPSEAKIAGPVHARWMYPIERYLGTLKSYVRNKARPEGSIAEAYISNESLTFLSRYLQGVETKFSRKERNYDNAHVANEGILLFTMRVRPFGDLDGILSDKEMKMTHWYILNNCDEVDKYILMHKVDLKKHNPHNVEARHQQQFATWLKNYINRLHHETPENISDDLWHLANGPIKLSSKYYSACIVNEVRFHTKDRDLHRTTQNSGLMVEGEHDGAMSDFYGFLRRVIELRYGNGKTIVLFECEWYNSGSRKFIHVDNHFLSIDTRFRWYKDQPYVLPNQVHQIYYLDDTKLGCNWKIIQQVQHRHLWDLQELEEEIQMLDLDVDNDNVEAVQQYESNGVILIQTDDDPSPLHREDVEPEEVHSKSTHKSSTMDDHDSDDSGAGLADVNDESSEENSDDYDT